MNTMIWGFVAICYVIAAIAFYTVACKTATHEVDLKVVESPSEHESRVA